MISGLIMMLVGTIIFLNYQDYLNGSPQFARIIDNVLIEQRGVVSNGYISTGYYVFKTYNSTTICSTQNYYLSPISANNRYNDYDYNIIIIYGTDNGVCITEYYYLEFIALFAFIICGGFFMAKGFKGTFDR
jgi:hypothetical protein